MLPAEARHGSHCVVATSQVWWFALSSEEGAQTSLHEDSLLFPLLIWNILRESAGSLGTGVGGGVLGSGCSPDGHLRLHLFLVFMLNEQCFNLA